MYQDSITRHILPTDFPKQLVVTGAAPKELFVLSQEKEPFPKGHYIALVGTRRPSNSAREYCNRIVEALKGTDAVIVSGLAQGIDYYCHKAALENNLKTVAVIAQGIELRIPGDRGVLAKDILKTGGTIISEYPGDMASFKGMFPARNRIIAGLSKETVIIESGVKGGALITAEFARKFNRKIYAVPGNFDKETAWGPLNLLRQGIAAPIYMPEDIKGLCGFIEQRSTNQGSCAINKQIGFLSPETKQFYLQVAGYTKTLTELSAICNATANRLFAILTELELADLCHTEDNFRYSFKKGLL